MKSCWRMFLLLLWLRASLPLAAQTYVRVNQAGYLPLDSKIAIAFGTNAPARSFAVCDAASGAVVWSGASQAISNSSW